MTEDGRRKTAHSQTISAYVNKNITSSIRNNNNAKTSRIKTRTEVSFLAPGIQQTYYLSHRLDGGVRVAPENVVIGRHVHSNWITASFCIY